MAEPEQGRARSRAAAVAAGGRAVPVGTLAAPFPSALLHRLGARLKADAAAEVASGRLALWLPVLFAAGALAYFGAGREPSLIAALVLVAVFVVAAGLARARPATFAVLVAAGTFAAGFAAGTVRTALVNHPILVPPPGPVRLTGFVEKLERRPKADRLLLRVTAADGKGLATPLRLVRLSVRSGTAPPPGRAVSVLARLQPPLAPALPGGHDFGRTPWFAGIDAVGFGLGAPKAAAAPGPMPLSVRIAAMLAATRQALAERIRASLTGTPADIAVALVAGDRATVDPRVEDSMRVSGLTHILSISGLHMAMVAGTLFALARAVLALVPGLALSFPVKSTAAALALAGSAFYLLLSGNDVPAQRSFIMAALVLAGVLFARPALTLRTVAVAALVVLAATPEAVLDPGTQMSFAATLALVAAYERLRPFRALPVPDGLVPRLAVKAAVLLGGVALTSLVAGLATAPYAAFHFQRVAPYGLLANLLAMPAVSLLVMPFGLLGVLLMPFGWDHLAWPVMGAGIEAMVGVSDFVARLPDADMRFDAMGAASLGCASLALAWATLTRGALAAFVVLPLAAMLALAGPAPRPDVLIAANGRTVAVRGTDGRLSVVNARAGRLSAEQWLTAEGDRRAADAPDLASAFACDRLGCTAPLPGGGRLAVSRRAEGLEADCLSAAIVATTDAPPRACPARIVTPEELARTGALALYRDGTGWRTVPARRPDVARPWLPAPPATAPEDNSER